MKGALDKEFEFGCHHLVFLQPPDSDEPNTEQDILHDQNVNSKHKGSNFKDEKLFVLSKPCHRYTILIDRSLAVP